MIETIKMERRRILNKRVFSVFLVMITLFSVYSSYVVVQNYNIPDQNGIAVTWRENLIHGKDNAQGQLINAEYLATIGVKDMETAYFDELNLAEIISMNYDGKKLEDLTKEDLEDFYARRLSNIRVMLEENQRITYTQEEIEQFMQSARKISELTIGYAEGWKVMNQDMGVFVSFLLILITVILLPLKGTDPTINMKELYRSTKMGKRHLDYARIITAFMVGSLLYLCGIILFFCAKTLPFGLKGWDQCIQSNAATFFSTYNITNLQQFLINFMIGFVALWFIISLSLFITVLMDGIIQSAVLLVFFWILLLLFDQMYLWPVNHHFANFMPLRMTSFSHYYIGNEIYRAFGHTFSCMSWSVLVAGLLCGILVLSVIGLEKLKRRRGIY